VTLFSDGFAPQNGKASIIKLTWLALGEDHAALSRRVEQLIALLRSVKPWRRPLGVLAAQFLSSATRVRAVAIN
jgi:hypothetical protein